MLKSSSAKSISFGAAIGRVGAIDVRSRSQDLLLFACSSRADLRWRLYGKSVGIGTGLLLRPGPGVVLPLGSLGSLGLPGGPGGPVGIQRSAFVLGCRATWPQQSTQHSARYSSGWSTLTHIHFEAFCLSRCISLSA